MRRIKAYLSHPIRGLKGANATVEDMEMNNYKAIYLGNILRAAFPNLDLHIPAEMEDFVSKAYHLNVIDESTILKVDCDIISDCDLVIFYNHQYRYSNGMQVEYNHARELGIGLAEVYEPSHTAVTSIETAILKVLNK